MVEIGRNKKYYENEPVSIVLRNRDGNHKIEIYKGIEAAIHPTVKSLYLMVDFSSRLIRCETVY